MGGVRDQSIFSPLIKKGDLDCIICSMNTWVDNQGRNDILPSTPPSSFSSRRAATLFVSFMIILGRGSRVMGTYSGFSGRPTGLYSIIPSGKPSISSVLYGYMGHGTHRWRSCWFRDAIPRGRGVPLIHLSSEYMVCISRLEFSKRKKIA